MFAVHSYIPSHVDRISGESRKRKIIERAVYIMVEEAREANAERMAGNERFQEVDTEWEYRYDDFFDAEQSLGSEEEEEEEEEPCDKREWEEEAKSCRLYTVPERKFDIMITDEYFMMHSILTTRVYTCFLDPYRSGVSMHSWRILNNLNCSLL